MRFFGQKKEGAFAGAPRGWLTLRQLQMPLGAVCPAILKHTSVYLPWIKIIAQVVCLMRMKLIGVRVFHEQSEDFSG